MAAAWTVVVVFALATIGIIALASHKSMGDLVKPLSDTYWLLLGGPFAALVLAKGITVSRLQNGTLTKTTQDPNFDLSDLTSKDDGGETDLVDFQLCMFNAVALLYVLIRFCVNPGDGLPEIPAALAGLTTVSALAYTANKAVTNAAAAVNSVKPSPAFAGQTVQVIGTQLGGQGPVTFAGSAVTLDSTSNANLISFTVPSGTAAGTYPLVISVPNGSQVKTMVTVAGIFLDPIAADGTSRFTLGQPVTLTIQLPSTSGANVPATLAATIVGTQVNSTPTGTVQKPQCTSPASGNSDFTNVPSTQQYVNYWDTSKLSAGDYRVTATLSDGTQIVGQFSLA